jgi:hypothetical protein
VPSGRHLLEFPLLVPPRHRTAGRSKANAGGACHAGRKGLLDAPFSRRNTGGGRGESPARPGVPLSRRNAGEFSPRVVGHPEGRKAGSHADGGRRTGQSTAARVPCAPSIRDGGPVGMSLCSSPADGGRWRAIRPWPLFATVAGRQPTTHREPRGSEGSLSPPWQCSWTLASVTIPPAGIVEQPCIAVSGQGSATRGSLRSGGSPPPRQQNGGRLRKPW